jgi:hypothetical protein
MQNHSLVRPTRHANRPRYKMQRVSACLPFMADLRNGTSYASWKVWSGSTTKEVRFVPMAKEPAMARKAAARIYRKAVKWNGSGKLAGRHGGLVGSHVLLVLHTLMFDFLNHATGRLDPSYKAIQRKTRLCYQTVAKALARLKELGILNWQQRSVPDHDVRGGFILRQISNAYAILPPTQWRGYTDFEMPEPPHATTWGASPPLPSLLEQAASDTQDGDSARSVVSRLDADPRDTVASAVASLFREVGV